MDSAYTFFFQLSKLAAGKVRKALSISAVEGVSRETLQGRKPWNLIKTWQQDMKEKRPVRFLAQALFIRLGP